MRKIYWSPEFEVFYQEADTATQDKIDYILGMMKQLYVVNSKFVKKLENTDYYEMRISVGNEYRVIVFTMDSPSFIRSTKVLLLNGFLKKATKDYKAQIIIAEKIKESYYGKRSGLGEDF